VNLAVTPCADGQNLEACYVWRVDLDALGLSGVQLAQFESDLSAGRALAGGSISPTQFMNFGPLGEFHGTEGWRAATDAPPQGTIYRVHDNGVRCSVAPCFSYDAAVVNTSQQTIVSDVVLSKVGATTGQVAAAMQALSTGSLLVAGTIQPQPNAGPAGTGQVLVATQFYLLVSSVLPSPTSTPTPTRTPTPTGTLTSTATSPPTATSPAPGLGGKGFGITSGASGVALTWQAGADQTGYRIARVNGSAVAFLPPSGPLGSDATSFADAVPPAGTDCYVLLVLGPSPPVASDLLCAMAGLHSATGAPEGFTLRLNQSATASLSWSSPPGGGQDAYLLATLGSGVQSLAGTATSASLTAQGMSCYILVAMQGAKVQGYTDMLCGLPGISTFGASQ
jgi:hypothetical protein